MNALQDRGRLKGHLRIDQFDAGGRFVGAVEADNLFLTSGINELWGLLTGASANHFDAANARIGIGDSSAGAVDTQTDLQAASNKTYKGMDGGYPTAPASKAVQFRATFGSADANYAWSEFVVKNNASGICIDRATGTWGTKASGTTWIATVTLSLA